MHSEIWHNHNSSDFVTTCSAIFEKDFSYQFDSNERGRERGRKRERERERERDSGQINNFPINSNEAHPLSYDWFVFISSLLVK